MRSAGTIVGQLGLSQKGMLSAPSRITAVLGPTNTGKTHFAVERLLAHQTGMMGFPLRLLAREIYDRVVDIKGPGRVALITGEEKTGASDAAYVIATVEAMPVHREFAFLAIDEIQLCADFDRGHVFTDRLLHARGYAETVFLGSDTIRPLIRKLVPEAEIITRPRMSTLSHAGQFKLNRLPRRSAIVAFSASEVYALAEMIRRRRGGAAVVMGSLSPRTRNAQVELYQSGDVDHLVATDAIGMGLNMDLGHVTFAEWSKFDGREERKLNAAEIGQIAGRAGRHMRDGTFGTTTRALPFDDKTVEAVENHQFPPLKALFWRNSDLDFRSLKGLAATLDLASPMPVLIKVRDALDDRCLAFLARHEEVARRATSRDTIMLLWQICQIPDFRKTLSDAHLQLLASIFDHLTTGRRKLPNDWVGGMIARLDRADGDIDTLTNRIAHVRTWTYLSHREDWLDDPQHWQGRAREVEDRLSDALHDRLTQKFVDRRTSALLRSLQSGQAPLAMLEDDGAITVDGHLVGRLDGFVFAPAPSDIEIERKVLIQAARRTVAGELARLADALTADPDTAFEIESCKIIWRGHPVAELTKAPNSLDLGVRMTIGDGLSDAHLRESRARLQRFVDGWLDRHLGCLRRLRGAADDARLGGAARGLVFRLTENQGFITRTACHDLIESLTEDDRKQLARLGVRLGVMSVHMPELLRPQAARALSLILRLHGAHMINPPPAGRVSLRGQEWVREMRVFGYLDFGQVAMRADIAERVGAELRRQARGKRCFALPQHLLALSGLSRDEFSAIMPAFGFTARSTEGVVEVSRERRPRLRKKARRHARPRTQAPAPGSPFAILADLKSGP